MLTIRRCNIFNDFASLRSDRKMHGKVQEEAIVISAIISFYKKYSPIGPFGCSKKFLLEMAQRLRAQPRAEEDGLPHSREWQTFFSVWSFMTSI